MPSVSTFFTDRRGGVSRPPYDEGNLGTHVGDDPAHVTANRGRLAAAVEAPIAWMGQVHGADVAVVDTLPAVAPTCDGLVTATRGLALGVLVADCVPVLLVDDEAGVVAAVHAGRRGAVAGVVLRALEAVRDLGGARPRAMIGPAICGRCYEVPAAMRAGVDRLLPGSATETSRGTPGLDLRAGLRGQLEGAGVTVESSPTCTFEDPACFSHRRDGVTGRQAGVVVLG